MAPKRDFEGGGRKPRNPRPRFRGFILGRKISKQRNILNQKLYLNRAPQSTNIYSERVPKGKHNRCQNISKINAKIGIERIIQIIDIMVFLIGRNIQIHYKQLFFEGLPGCVRERKRYKTISQIRPTSFQH